MRYGLVLNRIDMHSVSGPSVPSLGQAARYGSFDNGYRYWNRLFEVEDGLLRDRVLQHPLVGIDHQRQHPV